MVGENKLSGLRSDRMLFVIWVARFRGMKRNRLDKCLLKVYDLNWHKLKINFVRTFG